MVPAGSTWILFCGSSVRLRPLLMFAVKMETCAPPPCHPARAGVLWWTWVPKAVPACCLVPSPRTHHLPGVLVCFQPICFHSQFSGLLLRCIADTLHHSVATVVNFPKGSHIIRKGEPGEVFYIIETGSVVCRNLRYGTTPLTPHHTPMPSPARHRYPMHLSKQRSHATACVQ